MRVIAAPDKFKDAITAPEAAAAIGAGVAQAAPDAEVVLLPVADGGEGTAAAMVAATGGRMVTAAATDPLGRPITAQYGMLGGGTTAVVEMAEASGLALVAPAERRPLAASTEGTGRLIAHAVDRGASRIVVGIGGSATTDGGTGMARALGIRFLDAAGEELPPGGGALARLDRIDMSGLHRRVRGARILVASDVTSPLVGSQGSARLYAAQKGASPADIDLLDEALAHYGAVLEAATGVSVVDMPGAGAAGGLGAGLAALLGATLRPGIDLVLEAIGFDDRVEGADLVITGEGRADAQTAQGKAPAGVAAHAARLGVPVVLLAGQVAPGAEKLRDAGVTAIFALPSGPMGLDEARTGTAARLTDVTAQLIGLLCTFRSRGITADT